MKKIILAVIILLPALCVRSQKVDSFYFNLYTDSLKKGTFNYINVDGKLSDGRWLPLTQKQLHFSSSAGEFEGNNLWLDKDFSQDSVVVSVYLKSRPELTREITIYIKKNESTERLKTKEEMMQEMKRQRKKKSG